MRRQLPSIGLGLIFGLLTYFFVAYGEDLGSHMPTSRLLLLSLGVGILLAYLIRASTKLLNRLFSWKAQLGTRLLSGIVLNSVLAFMLLYGLLRILLIPSIRSGESETNFFALYTKLGILVFILVLIYSIGYFALYAYNQYSRVQIAQLQQDRRQIDLQLAALKAQLRPHFLFNSLNTISSLVHQNAQQAETFIRKLAKSYQYTLSSYDRRLVSVEEELDFVQSYHYMLETRYAEYLSLEVDLTDEVLATNVPPLTLQMLVENAAKHNQMTASQPLEIQIKADQDYIWVKNNKNTPPKHQVKQSLKIGLENINNRYKLLAGKEIIIQNQQDFVVKLPIIR